MTDRDPVTPGDAALNVAAILGSDHMLRTPGGHDPDGWFRYTITRLCEAVAAERANTASALAAMKRERNALRGLFGPDRSQSICGYTKCIELLESALFAAGPETTKEDG